MCTNPWLAVLNKNRQSKHKIIFLCQVGNISLDKVKVNDFIKEQSDFYGDNYVTIPCGRCQECIQSVKREWTRRNVIEFQKCGRIGFFGTLTYDDLHLPENGTLKKVDLQNFMKRLRKWYKKPIRFYCAGEYGSHTFRPHYHILLYGLSIPETDLVKLYNKDGYDYYDCEKLRKIWQKGNILLSPLNDYNISYTVGYVEKKLSKKSNDVCDKLGIQREFTLMSRRPGLGFSEDYQRHYVNDNQYSKFGDSGFWSRPLKFYDYMLKRDNRQLYDDIKFKRKQSNKRYDYESDLDVATYLQNKEESQKYKANKRRDLQ